MKICVDVARPTRWVIDLQGVEIFYPRDHRTSTNRDVSFRETEQADAATGEERRNIFRRSDPDLQHRCNQWTCSDRKSTRLNSSHLVISYAVFCLKQKT